MISVQVIKESWFGVKTYSCSIPATMFQVHECKLLPLLFTQLTICV